MTESEKIIELEIKILELQIENNNLKEALAKEKTKTYGQKAREKYPNAYRSWSIDDDERLKIIHQSGKTVEEIAVLFERTYGSIKSRLNKLNLK